MACDGLRFPGDDRVMTGQQIGRGDGMAKSSRGGRRAKLTKRTIDAAKAEAVRVIVWDSELPGFGLRIEPSGAKMFVARYRAGGGRTGTLRQKTLGRYGTLTAEEGRTAARKLLARAAGGADPVGDERAARQAGVTVGEACDWYIREAEAGRILGRRGRPIRALTISTDKTRIERHVKPLIGKRPVQSLALRDMETMQAHIALGKTAVALAPGGKRPVGGLATGGSGVAGRTLAMLRAILEHATRHGIIAGNPAKGVRKLPNERRSARFTLDQYRLLGEAMRASNENPTALAAVRLLALSGLRRGEALALRPDWIIEGGIDFPDHATKTGAQRRPLGRAALDTIKRQVAATGSADWVFPTIRGDGTGHLVGVPRVLRRLCEKAGLPATFPHALRHTFASVAAEIGFSELTIAGLLGHAAGSVTSGYIHLDRSLVAAADRVAEVIADALDGKARGEVVPLRSETTRHTR